MAIFGVITTLSTSSYAIYLAMKRPKINAMFAIMNFVLLLLPLLWFWVPRYGAVGAAWSLVVVASVNTVADYVVVLRLLQVHLSALLQVAWRTLFVASAMSVVLAFVTSGFTASVPLDAVGLQMGLSIAAGAASYLSALLLVWLVTGKPTGPETQIVQAILRWRQADSLLRHTRANPARSLSASAAAVGRTR